MCAKELRGAAWRQRALKRGETSYPFPVLDDGYEMSNKLRSIRDGQVAMIAGQPAVACCALALAALLAKHVLNERAVEAMVRMSQAVRHLLGRCFLLFDHDLRACPRAVRATRIICDHLGLQR